MKFDSKGVGIALAMAVGGVIAGSSLTACKSESAPASTKDHACAGKNACKSQGGCKTSDKGCAGKNSCAGKGGCAVPAKK